MYASHEATALLVLMNLSVVGLKALEQSAPRQQVIRGIDMLDSLKGRLTAFFETIAAEGRAITAVDIQHFFRKE